MEIPLLKDIVLVFGLAIVVLLICHRFHVAAVVGFFITGILAGPHGLGFIGDVKEVETLAEIGVILLLFTIGIEFSLENLLRIKRSVFVGGALQIFITTGFVFLLSRQFGLNNGQSIFIGFLVSLSSTAIVLRLLQQRAEIESPHGQTTLGILIFQDIAVVPMMLLTPYLAESGQQAYVPIVPLLLKGMIFLVMVFVGAKWIVPQLLYLIARTRSRELFMLSILVICFAVALSTHYLGLSIALGAFLAGLIISETEFSHQTLGNIIPFRDVFTSLFFISIGMLLDVKFLLDHPVQVISIALSVIILKSSLTSVIVLLLGLPLRTGILAGLALCQIGEFSFILFVKGAEFGILESRFYQLFLNVSVLTMGVTPFAIALASKLGDAVEKIPLPEKLKTGFYGGMALKTFGQKHRLREHLIIVGFGFSGRNLARVAQAAGISYVIIEMNPQTVKEERQKGESIYYGDASQESVLEHAGIKDAGVLVIVISDPMANRRITATARRENPDLFIVARTRFISEIDRLYALGANEVITEEFEASIEIFSRVLTKYLVPIDVMQKLISEAMVEGCKMSRCVVKEPISLSDIKVELPDMDIDTFRVAEGSPFIGNTLAQIDLRKKYGVTLLAIQRNRDFLSNPAGDVIVYSDDLLILLGPSAKLAALREQLS